MAIDKEELLEFLRENLAITAKIRYGMYCSDPVTYEIDLVLDGEVISQAWIDVPNE